jgi:asparagine synthase (glutamine-hydrolysing)
VSCRRVFLRPPLYEPTHSKYEFDNSGSDVAVSGLVGVWNFDERPVEPELLDGLMAPVAHRGPDGLHWWAEGSVALGCAQMKVTPESSTEVMPLVGRSGAVLVWDGRLDNREELFSMLRDTSPDVTPACPDPVLVMAAYERWGDRFPERLNGDFAIAVHDRAVRRLLLVRDAMGLRPLYWFQSGATALFSTQIGSILAHPSVTRRPNRDLLAEHFLLGPPQVASKSATFFEGINRVPEGGIVVLYGSNARQRQYWDFDKRASVRIASFEEGVEAFREHFSRAVERRLRVASKPIVAVSGGLDSSSIYGLAQRLHLRDPRRFPETLGVNQESRVGSPADEREFIRAIESMYGGEITRVVTSTSNMVPSLAESVRVAESPVAAPLWFDIEPLYRKAAAAGSRLLLNGQFGDEVVFDEGYLVDMTRRLLFSQVRAHLDEYPRWWIGADRAVFSRAFRAELARSVVPSVMALPLRRLRTAAGRPRPRCDWWAGDLRKRLSTAQLQRYPRRGEFASWHTRSIYSTVRSVRSSMVVDLLNKAAASSGMELAMPFLDRDLVGFLMAIPGEYLSFDGVPRAILREAMRATIPDIVADRRWKGDFSHRVSEGMGSDLRLAAVRLRDRSLAGEAGILDARAIEQHLSGWLADGELTYRSSRCLTEALGVEFWVEQFL